MLKYSLKRTSDPAVEPVTVAEAKKHLRLTLNDDDSLIANAITAARQAVERDTGKSLITQTWRLKMDMWPTNGITLFHGPVQSVTSVTYVNDAGSSTTWNSSEYDVLSDGIPGHIHPAWNYDWPEVRGDYKGISVVYVTGYGDTGSSVPYELRQAVLLRLEMFYDGENQQLVDAYHRIVNGASDGVYP